MKGNGGWAGEGARIKEKGKGGVRTKSETENKSHS